jgi:hypothetical protein
MAKTEFQLKTTPQDMVKQLTEWAKSLSPEEKAKARAALISQLKGGFPHQTSPR